MSKQTINIGTAANAKNGDSLRAAFNKVNQNFTELYTALGLDSGGLNLGAFEFTGSTITTTDSSSIVIDQATTVTSDLTVGGDLLPSVANGGDLGSAAKPWRSLYVSNNTIYIGGNSLGLDNNGNLAWNGSIVAHADGEFIRLDALTDVNAPNPNAGDTLAWMGSQYVNVPLREDRLHSEGDEVVLVSGANPYVTFPAITGGDQLQISGAEVSALSGNLAFSGQTTITLITNGAGAGGIGSQYFTLGADGSLTIPGTIGSEDEFKIEVNVSDSTKYIWRFGEDGELTFPDGTVQSSAGISASSTDTLTNKTINIQAGQGNVFQIQGNSITSYSGSGAVLALTSMPTFSGMNVNNSSLSIDGGSGSFYANTAFADGAGTIHKAGVYKSANNANNALFTFGANGAGTMSVVMDGSLFIGSALPANNGGLNTDYGGWLVVQAGAKFGGDLNTIGNFILDTPGNYVRFGDGTTQTTAADFGYLDLDKDTIKGTSDYQYTFATDGYFTASTSSESPNYFFVAYNTTNANIAAGWTVVGGTANTTVSSVTYPVAGYPGVIRVNLTAAASSTSGFYPVTVTSPDRLRVEIQPNPGTSDKFVFTTSGLTFPDATVQTTAYTGLQTSLVGAVDNNVLIRTSETVVTNNLYTNTTDFSTDVDIGGGTIISGWLQRNSEQIEISLFGPGAFRTYLTGLSLGRTVTVTYSTASGNQTLTRPLTQIFANIAQEDPNNPGWTRVAGRIDATLPVNQTGIVSINFPVTTTPQYDWTFSDTGDLTVPGEIHGAPVISGGAFPSQVGRTVNITPADDASDKKFKFRIDQYGETFTRAYLEFPTAEVDKQVAAVFPHTNGKAGYIYTQGADTNGQGMNDAFNIFYNSGDIKITSMGLSGGLYTWKFGDSGDLTIPGGIRSESNINIDINLSDSTLRRWRFGEDGDLTFPDNTVQTTAYTGNAATVDVMNTNGIDYNYSITFVENRSATQDLRADVDLTFNSWSNTLTTGNVEVKQTITGGIIESGSDFIITSQPNPDRNNACNIGIYPGGATGTASESGFVSITGGSSDVVGLAGGDVYIRGGAHTNGGVGGTIKVQSILKIDDGVHEKFQDLVDAIGTVTHDCASGHIFYHTSPDNNWTANFTNLNLDSGYATAVTLIIVQGATGYYPGTVQIDGAIQLINWPGGIQPTPSTNRTDVVTFSIINNSGTYIVLGQLTGF